MRTWTLVRSELANAVKTSAPPEHVEALRRDLRIARAHSYLQALVTVGPPLTPAQRLALAAVLVGGGDDAT